MATLRHKASVGDAQLAERGGSCSGGETGGVLPVGTCEKSSNAAEASAMAEASSSEAGGASGAIAAAVATGGAGATAGGSLVELPAGGLAFDGSVAVALAVGASPCQPGGATTCTMLSHLGQERIWPMAAALRTFSFAWQVVQVMLKGSTACPVLLLE